MDLFQQLVEQRIEAAMAAGEFDALPGAGRPLDLTDDALVPPELRMAWRILKNAGYIPPEVEALRDVAQLEQALAHA
ncbi:MAG: DnaJ family domain-containing protein, partial [Burkholderiales bacterium]